jgi:hypothetical protein
LSSLRLNNLMESLVKAFVKSYLKYLSNDFPLWKWKQFAVKILSSYESKNVGMTIHSSVMKNIVIVKILSWFFFAFSFFAHTW